MPRYEDPDANYEDYSGDPPIPDPLYADREAADWLAHRTKRLPEDVTRSYADAIGGCKTHAEVDALMAEYEARRRAEGA